METSCKSRITLKQGCARDISSVQSSVENISELEKHGIVVDLSIKCGGTFPEAMVQVL